VNEAIPSGWNCDAILLSGDGICDTPADPGINVCGGGCNPSVPCNNEQDQNLEFYNPDRQNIMSYYGCTPEHFSHGQYDVMWQTINNHPNRVFLLSATPDCTDVGRVDKISFSGSTMVRQPLPSVEIEIVNNSAANTSDRTTDGDGEYDIAGNNVTLGVDEDVTVKAVEVSGPAGNPLNGVTTYDIVKLKKHILGLETLQRAEYWIAADVNYSGAITTFDEVIMRKLILGLTTTFPRDSWAFVPEYYLGEQFTFNDAYKSNPFTAVWDSNTGETRYYKENLTASPPELSYLTSFDISLMNPDVYNEETWNIRAIKIGDLNGSASPEYAAPPPPGDPILVTIDEVFDGTQVKYDFKVEGFTNIVAYQMEIAYDENILNYVQAQEEDLTGIVEDFFADFPAEGTLNTLWYDDVATQSITLPDMSKIFQLVYNYTGTTTFTGANIVSLYVEQRRESRLNAEYSPELRNFAVDKDGIVHPILVKGKAEKGVLSVKALPNPFSEELRVDIRMGYNDYAKIEIYNVLGQVIHQADVFLKKGKNVIDLSGVVPLTKGLHVISVSNDQDKYSIKVVGQ
jgi:hypothetical protein